METSKRIFAIVSVVVGIFFSSETTSQPTPRLKQLEQQALERLEADRRRRRELEADQFYQNALSSFDRADYTTAINAFGQAANLGKREAYFKLATMYEEGIGVEKNIDSAIANYTRAATMGLSAAMTVLGVRYYDDKLVPRDYKAAYEWFLKAAMTGDPSGELMVGVMHFYGEGVKKDRSVAVTWLAKSAQKGSPQAKKLLAVAYTMGWGTTRNIGQAIRLYLEIIGSDDARISPELLAGVLYNVGELYYAGEDYGIPTEILEAQSAWSRVTNLVGTDNPSRRLSQAGLACIEDGKPAKQCRPLRCYIEDGDQECPPITDADLISDLAKARIQQAKINEAMQKCRLTKSASITTARQLYVSECETAATEGSLEAVGILATYWRAYCTVNSSDDSVCQQAEIYDSRVSAMIVEARTNSAPEVGNSERIVLTDFDWKKDPGFGARGTIKWTVRVRNQSTRTLESAELAFLTFDKNDRILARQTVFIPNISPERFIVLNKYSPLDRSVVRAEVVTETVRFAGDVEIIQSNPPAKKSKISRNLPNTARTGLAEIHSMPSPADYYPKGSAQREEEGAAIVRVCIDDQGKIIGLPEITKTATFPSLDDAAIRVALNGHYLPETENGTKYQKSCVDLRVVFALQ